VDHSEYRICGQERVIEPFEQQHSCPFTDEKALSSVIERATFSLRRECPELRESHLGEEAIGPRNSSRKYCVTSVSREILAGDGDGVE